MYHYLYILTSFRMYNVYYYKRLYDCLKLNLNLNTYIISIILPMEELYECMELVSIKKKNI